MRLDKHASSRRRQQAATHRPADLKLSRFKMSTELLCFFDSVSVCACAHRRRSSRNQWYAHSPRCHRLGWLTILRHRRCPNQRLFTVHTGARTARCRRPVWRRYPLRRPRLIRHRRPERHRRARRRRSLSHPPTAARTRSERAGGPQTRMLAHTHTLSGLCSVLPGRLAGSACRTRARVSTVRQPGQARALLI